MLKPGREEAEKHRQDHEEVLDGDQPSAANAHAGAARSQRGATSALEELPLNMIMLPAIVAGE